MAADKEVLKGLTAEDQQESAGTQPVEKLLTELIKALIAEQLK